jgi:outer membrane protein OmpA-like peptidoglycan-associated protein
MLRRSRDRRTPTTAHAIIAAGVAALSVVFSRPARAVDFTLALEPGVAIPLSAPQSQVYGVGVGQSLKALVGLTPYLDIGPNVSFMILPASAALAESGVVWGFGAGPRLKRPHEATSYRGLSPWLDADLLYVRTGTLDRLGFDAAIGLAVPIGSSRTFWVGPFARYLQVIQPNRAGYDDRDAKLLTLGVSFEVGSGVAPSAAPPHEPVASHCEACAFTDRDLDGIADTLDRCPEAKGPMSNGGCPVYEKIVVTKDKLELKEKLFFANGQATIEEKSFPVLDEVVRALNDNKLFRVQVEGHTDSSGSDDHNQSLSERRAGAVLEYLATHGVSRERLISKGFSSSVPRDTNNTAEGRENNRRVDFVVFFTILNEGSAK